MNYDAEELIKLYESLKSDRENMYSIWEDCRHYYDSEKQNMQPDRNTVEPEKTSPLNSVGYDSTFRFASGLHSNTYDAGEQFFTFKVSQAQLGENEDLMKDWAIDAGKISDTSFNMILNYVRLNTGVIYFEWNEEEGIVFKEIPITDCCIAEDSRGIISTMIREYKYTARQAFEKWGNDCHSEVIKMAKDSQRANEKLTYLHFVMPNKKYNKDSKASKDLRFKSCYVNRQYKYKVEEGGYSYFPFAVPRFLKDNATPYGRGQSFPALDIMRTLSQMCKNIDDGVELKTNPPVFAYGNVEEGDIDLEPGGWNNLSSESQVTHYQSDIDLPAADAREIRKEEEVRRMFFNDVFVTIEGEAALKNVTATAIDFLRAERIQALLPIVNRLYTEFYDIVTKGVLLILIENREIEPPPGINIKNLRVEYSNKLAQKLKLQESAQILQGIMEVQDIQMRMQEAPGLKHLVNVDEIARDLFRAKNIPSKYIKDEDETEEARALEAQAQAEMMQQQQMMDHIGQADPMKAPEPGSMMSEMEQ